jgi:uncharacterized protein
MLLIAPVLEEYVLRDGLQTALFHRLNNNRPSVASRLAIIVSALTFATFHMQHGFVAAVSVVPPALVIGALYQRTRSWRSCALVHAMFNSIALMSCVRSPIGI